MAHRPRIVRTVSALHRAVAQLREADKQVALVPTMGALHGGHIALVRAAKRRAQCVVVSIFVNPAQFAPNEDLVRYPRTFDSDLDTLGRLGVDLVWAPATETMYPPDFATRIVPEGPAKVGLEDKFRPHFFSGVATVVGKLFVQCRPDLALFGEKDYQQLLVVKRLVSDLDLPVRIIGIPTIREDDGLAMSSRNALLSQRARAIAPTLYRALQNCRDRISSGASLAQALGEGATAIERAGLTLDYLEARNSKTLRSLEAKDDTPMRLLVAARIEQSRLIDNLAVESSFVTAARRQPNIS